MNTNLLKPRKALNCVKDRESEEFTLQIIVEVGLGGHLELSIKL